jgi:S1-C subfamily serine protease
MITVPNHDPALGEPRSGAPPIPPATTGPQAAPWHRRSRAGVAVAAGTSVAVLVGSLLVAAAVVGFDWQMISIGPAPSADNDTVAALGSAPGTGLVVTGLTDVSDLAAQVSDAVVTVQVRGTFRGRERLIGSGSGVIIDQDGTIVTNAHVVEVSDRATAVDVVLADGSSLAATVLAVDPANDLALVDIDADGLAAIAIGSTDQLLVGDPVIAIGNPLGLEGGPSVSTGIISALDRSLDGAGGPLSGVLQTDAAITEGSSGGALLDAQGRLVGITTAVGVSSVGIEGIGFALPVEDVVDLVQASGL